MFKKNSFCQFIFLNCFVSVKTPTPASTAQRSFTSSSSVPVLLPRRRRRGNLPHPPDDENEALLLLWLLGEANRSPNNGMRFAVVGGVVVIVEIVRLVDETKAIFSNQSSGVYPVVSASRRRGWFRRHRRWRIGRCRSRWRSKVSEDSTTTRWIQNKKQI